jgi:hypothetical protein
MCGGGVNRTAAGQGQQQEWRQCIWQGYYGPPAFFSFFFSSFLKQYLQCIHPCKKYANMGFWTISCLKHDQIT